LYTTHMRYVALLRGIMPMNPNMSAKRLASAFEEMGFKNVATVISSGNVVFDSPVKDATKLETKIEAALPKLLKFKSTTMVRSFDELEKFVAKKPFKKPHSREHYALVTFFKDRRRELCQVLDVTKNKTPDLMSKMEKKFGKEITSRTFATVERILKKK
jgi:uncharacterized protein (DUF1697 family)